MAIDLNKLQLKRAEIEMELKRREEETRALQAKLKTLSDAEAILMEDEVKPIAKTTVSKSTRPVGESKVGKRTGAGMIIRDIVRTFGGPFSIRDVMAFVANSDNERVRALDERSATSTLYNWCQLGRLEQVEERRGNIPSKYSVIEGALDDLNSRKSRVNQEFPLSDMILSAVKSMSGQFAKGDVFAYLMKTYPEHQKRFKLDSVGAKLNTLAHKNKGVRFIKQSSQGNVYAAA